MNNVDNFLIYWYLTLAFVVFFINTRPPQFVFIPFFIWYFFLTIDYVSEFFIKDEYLTPDILFPMEIN